MPKDEEWWCTCDPETLVEYLRRQGIDVIENGHVFLKWHSKDEDLERIIGRVNVEFKDGEPVYSESEDGEGAVEEWGGKQTTRPSGQVVADIECEYVIPTGECGNGARNVGIKFRTRSDGQTDVAVFGDDQFLSGHQGTEDKSLRDQVKEAMFKAAGDKVVNNISDIARGRVGAGELDIKTEISQTKGHMEVAKRRTARLPDDMEEEETVRIRI